MPKLDRLLKLVYALSDTSDGLTLDEMAACVNVHRRTAERMRVVIEAHFDLEPVADDRQKRFRIRDSLRRVFTRPTAEEVAALEAEVSGLRRAGQDARVAQLAGLLAKVKGALDSRERTRLAPDLEPLVRLQRTLVPAGPVASVAPETVAMVQAAILEGRCIEFGHATDDRPNPRWRRVVPYGLVHGPVTYLIGRIPERDNPPVYYRLDRMVDPRLSAALGAAPANWDIDAWLVESFAVWRDEKQHIVLRVPASAAGRARRWRFHPGQELEDLPDGGVRIRFSSGGMRELAEHLFTWGGELTIEGPLILVDTLRERIAAALSMLPVDAPTPAIINRVGREGALGATAALRSACDAALEGSMDPTRKP